MPWNLHTNVPGGLAAPALSVELLNVGMPKTPKALVVTGAGVAAADGVLLMELEANPPNTLGAAAEEKFEQKNGISRAQIF